ncbi:MAG: GGDEF domain-containing protein [Myxococcaceae bacterium]|nr:GGDEF domain-containing protein [Myxococcaceae bacterium]MCI0673998.1 GGDEF domain-containing protein [Myxococcaceae bacterium]
MKLQHTLTDAQALALMTLHPWAAHHGDRALSVAIDALLEAEQGRRGAPDAKTGAVPVAALLQGTLLKAEVDPSLHGDAQGWPLDAVVVDVRGMMGHNARLGFARGDALLRAVVEALREALPSATVVRLHADAFAALLGPTSGVTVDEADRGRVEAVLASRLAPFAGTGDDAARVETVVALLVLRVVQPAHWQVLGPLVWSELERALLLEKLGRADGLQRRRIELGAAIPGEPTASGEPTPRG